MRYSASYWEGGRYDDDDDDDDGGGKVTLWGRGLLCTKYCSKLPMYVHLSKCL